MKSIKIIVICALIIFIVFLVFKKSEKINIDGNWSAKEIVLNGQQILHSEVDKYLNVELQVTINTWTDSIISNAEPRINAHFKVEKSLKDNNYIILSSSEKSLNGRFQINIDTLHIGPQAYRVDLKLERNNTLIYIQKEIIIPLWKPEFPKRGKV